MFTRKMPPHLMLDGPEVTGGGPAPTPADVGRTVGEGVRDRLADGQPAPAAAPAHEASPTAVSEPTLADRLRADPEWGEREIERLRRESTKDRLAAKETAAEEARRDFSEKIAVALGLKPDAAQDPAALTQSLTAAQQAHKQSQIQLAVYRASGAAGANPDALLDSNTFLASVQSLDPTSADFSTKVAEAITAATTANPSLKAARAAGASTVETPGGTGEQGQITEAQLAQMTPEQIAEAYDKGLLTSLLT